MYVINIKLKKIYLKREELYIKIISGLFLSDKLSISNKYFIVEDTVPAEIRLMTDKKSVPLYLKLLESGSEKKRDIRLVIVGKKGTGKTSLVKRLFSEEISKIREVASTNGIDIHKMRCIANSDDGMWNKLDGMMSYF